MLKSFFLFLSIALLVAPIMGGGASSKTISSASLTDELVSIDQMPELINREAPTYPAKAKAAGIEGYVKIEAFVNEKGEVSQAKVVKCSKQNFGLEDAALDAAYKSIYQPATQNGKPISAWISYDVKFSLDDDGLPSSDEFISVDQMPVQIYEEIPAYPQLAKEGGFTGYVILKAYVDENGDVKKVRTVKTNRPNMGFEEAAVKAAYKCKYQPATQNGQPVGIWISYKVTFSLEGE